MATQFSETTEDVIASFMQQLIVEYQSFGDAYRRKEPRETVAIPISVCLLDGNLRPMGNSFQAVTRDLSYRGVGLFHTQPVEAPYALVKLTAPETRHRLTLLAQLEHCTQFGGFYLIGCRFARVCSDDLGPAE